MLSVRIGTAGGELVLWPISPGSDWLRIPLGLAAALAPFVFWGGRAVLVLQAVGGVALVAAGVWGMARPRVRAPQWLALAAAGWLMLWPSALEPAAVTAPWVGIIAGLLGALLAAVRLTDRPGKGSRLGQRGRAQDPGGTGRRRQWLRFNPR